MDDVFKALALKLTVIHDGFDQDSPIPEMVSNGWPRVLSDLKTLLETGKAAVDDQEAGSPRPGANLQCAQLSLCFRLGQFKSG